MRFGINTFLISSGFTNLDAYKLEELHSYGADFVELAIVDPSAVSISLLKKSLASANSERPIVCGAFVNGRDLRGSKESQLRSIQYIKQLISIAREIGSEVVCGPIYSEGGRSSFNSQIQNQEQKKLVASHLCQLCKIAEKDGIVIALEPLNRFETDFINTIEQGVDLIQSVGSPALKIHADTFHMNIEEENTASTLIKFGDYIGHIHASASHRGIIGEDQVDWVAFFKALREIDYQGDIAIESFSTKNQKLAEAVSIWRSLYDTPKQYAEESLSFLRETWQSMPLQNI